MESIPKLPFQGPPANWKFFLLKIEMVEKKSGRKLIYYCFQDPDAIIRDLEDQIRKSKLKQLEKETMIERKKDIFFTISFK